VSIAVEVSRLRKLYPGAQGPVVAVDDVSFRVEEGEMYTLLGPSGCGKTSTMRCIAGLEHIDGGSISVFGQTVSSMAPPVFVPPYRRGMGMVFQSYAIWPHLTVFENVAFPLRVSAERASAKQIKSRVGDALELVQLEPYADRMATQLSGGQQQRLALARAIVGRPQVLLLDEPLSNLDARLRDQMRAEIRSIQLRLGVTAIYVTHDQVEALSMSSRIAVMSAGKIVQEGRPRDLYANPSNSFVAEFIGNSNVFEAVLVGAEGEAFVADSPGGRIRVIAPLGVNGGERVTVSVRPENIVVSKESAHGALPAKVESIAFMGELVEMQLRIGDMTVRARFSSAQNYDVGDELFASLPPQACTVVSQGHGVRVASIA
jgi:iron(III) transport system ATP-binding protein